MADRIIILPTTLTARQNATVPRLDYQFVYPDPFVDAKVRLVVYHLGLYGERNALSKQEGPNFAKFKKSDAVLDDAAVHARFGTELNPNLVNESGVLLKLDGSLQHSAKAPPHRGWWFSKRAEPVENIDKPFSVIRLYMPTTEEDAIAGRVNRDAIARIIVRDDLFQNMYAGKHRIVFRVALTHPHARLEAGAVIASSLCPDHNPACSPEPPNNPFNTGRITLDESAVLKGKPPTIGGPETPAATLSPTPNPRFMPFDFTGSYEQFSSLKDPALLVQVNQAGHTLVGWFSFPISTSPSFAATRIPGLPVAPGCFIVNSIAPEIEDKDKGFQLEWMSQPDNDINTADPDSLINGKEGSLGWIKRITAPAGADGVSRDGIEIIFENPDGTVTPKIVLTKIRRGARWPWQIIDNPSFLSKDEKEAMVADQIRPVPKMAWERLRIRLNPFTVVDSAAGKTLKDLIQDWRNAADGSDRLVIRVKVSNYLVEIMSPFFGHGGDYRRRAAERLQAYAAQYSVTIDTSLGETLGNQVTNSLLGWLKSMVSQHMTELIEKRDAGSESDKKISDQRIYEIHVEQGFKDAEINPAGKYVYTLKFKKRGIPKVPVLKVYVFSLSIMKEIRQADKTLVPDTSWTNKGSESKSLHGYFIATGAGVGLNIIDGKSAKGKAARGGAFPGEAVFESFSDLVLSDFNDAWFSIVALEAGDVDVFVKFKMHASSLFQLKLDNGVRLTANVSEELPGGFDAGSDMPSGGTLFDLSAGMGKITTDDISKGIDPPDDSSETILAPQTKDVLAWVPTSFDKDSATVVERQKFEQRLAMGRGFFETEQPKARVLGYSSPEGSFAHNMDLSGRRAAAVRTAVLDAFEPEMALVNFDVVGMGEEPSIRKGGLLDPPGKTEADRIRIHREEVQYPIWRAVDLFVGTQLIVRAAPKDEQKGKSK